MSLQIRAKGITLHDGTKAHIEGAVEAFRKYSLEMTNIDCVVASEKKGVMVEFNIKIAHAQPVVITQHDDDLDTAIDLAIERATKALRRLHDKVVSHRNDSLKEIDVVDA